MQDDLLIARATTRWNVGKRLSMRGGIVGETRVSKEEVISGRRGSGWRRLVGEEAVAREKHGPRDEDRLR